MSDDDLYHQTKASLSAISTDLQRQLREDLGQLRTAIDERLAAFDAILVKNDAFFDRVAQDVAIAANVKADQAARQARLDAEQVAQRDLDAARAQAHDHLAALRAETDTARATLETRLAEAETKNADIAAALESAHHENAAMQRAWDDQAHALDEVGHRLRTLEAEHAEWTLARQVAEAHLEEERQRRKTIAIQLETAHEELRLAKAEVKSSRLETQQIAERVSILEKAHTPPAAAAQIGVTTDSIDRIAVLDRLKTGLQALNNAQTADEVLNTLLESLAEHFDTTAMFAATAQGFRLWRGRRAGMPIDVQHPVVPATADSLLGRAFRERTAVVGDASDDDAAPLVGEAPVGRAAALPVVGSDRVLAIAYVVSCRERSELDVLLFTKLAEILVERVNQRMLRSQPLAASLSERPLAANPDTAEPPSAESPHYALTRQARRVPIHDGVQVFLDGVTSALVDLSTLGAQVVSPSTIRPNRGVRILLPCDGGPLACKARIVWARAEPGQQDESVLYRAGLEFTDADVSALQAFAAQYGVACAPSATASKH